MSLTAYSSETKYYYPEVKSWGKQMPDLLDRDQIYLVDVSGGGGGVLKEFLGGDVLLGPWTP